jgi:hypothetical protein
MQAVGDGDIVGDTDGVRDGLVEAVATLRGVAVGVDVELALIVWVDGLHAITAIRIHKAPNGRILFTSDSRQGRRLRIN